MTQAPVTPADLGQLRAIAAAGPHAATLRKAFGSEALKQAADNAITKARAEHAAIGACNRERARLEHLAFNGFYRDEQERFHVWLFDRCGVTPMERHGIAVATLHAQMRQAQVRGVKVLKPFDVDERTAAAHGRLVANMQQQAQVAR